MTIAFVTESYLPATTRPVRELKLLEEQLRLRGHRTRVITPPTAGVRLRDSAVRYVPAIPFPGSSSYQLTFPALSNAAPVLRDADVIHIQQPFVLGSWAQTIAQRLGKPTVFSSHTSTISFEHSIPSNESLRKRPFSSVVSDFANECTVVIASSEEDATRLRENGVRRPIRVVPPSLNRQKLSQGSGSAWRSALGIPTTSFVALSIDSLGVEGQADTLVRAIASLDESYHLVIVGDGARRSNLEALTQQLGATPRVHLIGEIGNRSMPDIYAGANTYIATNTPSPATLEALAAGVPLITTSSTPGGIHMSNASLLVPATATGFAHGFRQLKLRPALRHQLRDRARQVSQSFAIETTTTTMLDLYRLAQQLTVPVR